MLKSFDEFLSTEFSEEDAAKVANEALTTLDPNLKQLPMEQKLAMIAGIQVNSAFFKEILRKYHNWLTQQLQQQ